MAVPGENVQSWSKTASLNGGADILINWAEGMPRADVNNSARSTLAALAKDRDLHNGSIVTGGSVNAQTFTSGIGYTIIPTNLRVMLKIGPALTNTGATTLSMDSITAVTVKNRLGADLVGGELKAGQFVEFVYDGTNWILWHQAPATTPAVGDPPIVIVQPPVVVVPATPVPSINIINLTNAYAEYVITITNLFPVTDQDSLIMRFSTDNGVTWLTTLFYSQIFTQFLGSDGIINPSVFVFDLQDSISLTYSLDTTNPLYPSEVCVHLYGVGTATFPQITFDSGGWHDTSAGVVHIEGRGNHYATSNINGVQFSMASGANIASGRFTVSGVL